ncbi:NAD(P)H-binding protein [Paenibacillus naphthalenovorans]|uniref:NAD(P)H-binding protein n=1 Tax=Paenibacillus naphthalenovorans TaxID=162209 RepID=UPI003D2E9537
MKNTAIVAGATGLVGRELVRLLLSDLEYDKVIALVRRPIELNHEKLIQRMTDWEEGPLEQAIKDDLNGSHVFCALGTTIRKAKTKEQFRKVDFDYPVRLGRLAKKYGASSFLIVSAMGASKDSLFFYSQVKGEVEESLKDLDLPSLHIFRPSLLLGQRDEFRFGEKMAEILGGLFSFLMIGGLRQYKPITGTAVAQGMIQAAKKGSKGTRIYRSDQIKIL